MKTILTSNIQKAADFIRRGELVSFPTETVYGLGADSGNETAVEKIFLAKNRPVQNPLIVHIAGLDCIAALVSKVSADAERFLEAFFPGPLTLILEKQASIPSIVTAGLPTVGIRMPGSAFARDFIRASGCFIAAPSANISGRPSPTTWQAVHEDLDGRIACILQGERATLGLESTVVDCTRDNPVVLRPGSTTLMDLQQIVPTTYFRTMDGVEEHAAHDASLDALPKSPGMAFRHYSPHARVAIVEASDSVLAGSKTAFIGLDLLTAEPPPEMIELVGDVDEYAQRLFDFFRRCDRVGIETIFCQSVREKGLGLALMDRIRRASE